MWQKYTSFIIPTTFFCSTATIMTLWWKLAKAFVIFPAVNFLFDAWPTQLHDVTLMGVCRFNYALSARAWYIIFLFSWNLFSGNLINSYVAADHVPMPLHLTLYVTISGKECLKILESHFLKFWRRLTPNLKGGNPPFSRRDHGFKLGDALSNPGYFALRCKPPQWMLKVTV